ncbi:MAG TPA: outer membrane protein transport protein [Chthoniobacteraceae bacterium]
MKFVTPLVLLCAVALAPSTFGLGIRVMDQNADATGRGNAFSATADNPSAVYYNPAGITQLDGLNVVDGIYGVNFDTRIHLDLHGTNGFDNKWNPQAAPQFFASWKPKKDFPVTFGLGVYAPYGFAIKYDDDVPFRTIGVEGEIQYFTISPVVAWQINDKLSISAGPTINYAKADLQRGIIKPGDEFRLGGSDIAGGAVAGIMWKPTPQHSFGLMYHSATGMEFQGHTNVKFDNVVVPVQVAPGVTIPVTAVKGVHTTQPAKADFHFPQFIMGGYSFRPTPDWNFEADVEWTDWDSLNSVIIHQKAGDLALPFNWRSSFTYKFGATRNFGTYHVSAGYMYAESSVPNESFNPLIPDSNHHVFSVGIGRKIEHWSWDIAYQFTYGPTRTISQGSLADGQYKFESNAITLSLGYVF